MKFRLLCVTLMLLLSSCATPTYNYAPETIAISEPPLGLISTVRIGDIMLKQGKYREHEACYLQAARKIGVAYTLQPGYYLKDGGDGASEFFSPRDEGAGRIDNIFLADRGKAVMTRNNRSELCIVSVYNNYTCEPVGRVDWMKRPVLAHDAFQQTLIYNGKVGSRINIAYREFSNNMARPAFNNNVEYDLSESANIAYKGAELEVLEATNQHIKFKLHQNFNAVK